MIKNVFILCLLFLISCKNEIKNKQKDNSIETEKKESVEVLPDSQDMLHIKTDNISGNGTEQLIDRKLELDLESLSIDKCKSRVLDILLKKENYNYILGDYAGTNQEDYYCYVLGLFDDIEYRGAYVLFFDNDDILKDTLRITNKKISLNVLFDNNERGVALGDVDEKKSKNIYFEITSLYQIDANIKLQKISLETKIKKCPLPLDYLSEEYEGIENYFNYGIKK